MRVLCIGLWILDGAACAIAADCNQNRVDDFLDIVPDRFRLVPNIGGQVGSWTNLQTRVFPTDLDGDGKPDALIASTSEGTVQPMFSVSGKFQPTSKMTIFPSLPVEAVGDMDGDHDADLVALDDLGAVLYSQTERGRFNQLESIPLGSRPIDALLIDVSGDGALDLIASNSLAVLDATTVSVLLNSKGAGESVFEAPRHFTAGNGSTPMAVSDMNGDSAPEIIVWNKGSGRLSMLVNDRLGGFTERLEILLPANLPATVSRLLAADVEGDGKVDLILALGDGSVLVMSNRDGKSFEPSGSLLVPRSGFDLMAVDLNGDHAVELVSVGAACVGPGALSDLFVLWNNGRASWDAPQHRGLAKGFLHVSAANRSDGAGGAVLALLRDPDSTREMQLVAFGAESSGISTDLDHDSVPDECQADCNGSGWLDSVDARGGLSSDCDSNLLPDECEPDCDSNGVPDSCDITSGAPDCDSNGFPDACDVASGLDLDGNGTPDSCDVASGAPDCDSNGVADRAELLPTLRFRSKEYGLAAYLHGLAVGDFDGDEHADVIAMTERGAIWLQGQGDVGFAVRSGRSHGLSIQNAGGFVAADFDGDGDLDLALHALGIDCGGQRSWIETLLNDGNAVFTATSRLWTGREALGLAAGDLDEDGDLDLAALTRQGVSVASGLGRAGFDQPINLEAIQTDLIGRGVSTLDVDGDDDLDLAVGSGRILANSGGGRFEPLSTFQATGAGLGDLTDVLRAHDIDRDGDLDLLSGIASLNDGNGRFKAGTEAISGSRCVEVADWNADGRADWAVGIPGRTLLHRGKGDGTFTGPEDRLEYDEPRFLATADFNEDGVSDLVFGNGARDDRVVPRVRIELGGLDRALEGLEGISILPRPVALTALDADGDGGVELLAMTDKLTLIRGAGSGHLSISPAGIANMGVQFLAPGDLDGDARMDAIGQSAETAEIYWGRGDGTFETQPVPGTAGDTPLSAALADADQDGSLDAILFVSGGAAAPIALLKNLGARTFGLKGAVPVRPDRLLAVGDFTGDPAPDIVLGVLGGALLLEENDGSGVFTGREPIPTPFSPALALVQDFDGDGRRDVLAGGTGCKGCEVGQPAGGCACGWMVGLYPRGGGDAVLSPRSSFVPGSVRGLAAADFDGDSDADLVGAVPEENVNGSAYKRREALFLQNDGEGRFESGSTLTSGSIPNALVAQDLNLDGRPDVALLTNEGIVVHINTTGKARAIDSDHDGVPDICEAVRFRRGDWNQDGQVNLSDPVALLGYLFEGVEAATCHDSGDADDSSRIDITDVVVILAHLFLGGAPPAEPYPACGNDVTPGPLGCDRFNACE